MLTLQCDISVPALIAHSEGIGIDIWLTNFIATSNGLLVQRQKFFIDAERKLQYSGQFLKRDTIAIK
jgi:putative transposase